MSSPPASARRALGARAVWIVFGVLALLTVILTPEPGERSGGRLTTYSHDEGGASGLYAVAHRLGWRVSRRVVPFRDTPGVDARRTAVDSTVSYVLLDPPYALTSGEVARLLAAVRAGAGLLVAPEANTPLADSLHLGMLTSPFAPFPLAESPLLGVIVTGAEADSALLARWPTAALAARTRLPRGTDTLLAARVGTRSSPRRAPVALSIPLGRGRVVVLADAGVLRNDELREGSAGVLAVRLLERLPAGAPLVFDEYHQGFGEHASMSRAVWRFLTVTTWGRALLEVIVAALVLLAAAGARALAPLPRQSLERRSPLEHVAALAGAYRQVRGTRTVARRLVRGLRRRRPLGVGESAGEDAYLEAVRVRHPVAAPQVALLASALAGDVPADRLDELGAAIVSIERTLTPQ